MTLTPNRPQMPSLNSLRAFEAVARLASISAAADELFVTPGAIAQHIKSLEEWAGVALIKRNARSIELTPLAYSVLPEFQTAFDQMGKAVHKLHTKAAPNFIRIAALPSIAQLWLSPRLPELRNAIPELLISVSALERPPNLVRDPFDMAIFFKRDIQGDNISLINKDKIFPVASPEIAKRVTKITDLQNEVLLHDLTWRSDWKTWLSHYAPGIHTDKGGPEFTLYALALEECKNGAGILIGHESLVKSHLESGELVPVFENVLTTPQYLTLETSDHIKKNPQVKTVMDYIIASA